MSTRRVYKERSVDQTRYCYVCADERRCYLAEDDRGDEAGGFCERCGVCQVCPERVYAQVEWVSANSVGQLVGRCAQVCEKHIAGPANRNPSTVIKMYIWSG